MFYRRLQKIIVAFYFHRVNHVDLRIYTFLYSEHEFGYQIKGNLNVLYALVGFTVGFSAFFKLDF